MGGIDRILRHNLYPPGTVMAPGHPRSPHSGLLKSVTTFGPFWPSCFSWVRAQPEGSLFPRSIWRLYGARRFGIEFIRRTLRLCITAPAHRPGGHVDNIPLIIWKTRWVKETNTSLSRYLLQGLPLNPDSLARAKRPG